MSQSAKPSLQRATAQREAMHADVPLGTAQARPQAPQCCVDDVVLASQPLVALPSQSAKPAVQVSAQRPPVQAGTALSAPMHTVPQAPQWETLVAVAVSQPLAALPSQSPKPAAHMATVHWPIVQAAVALARSQRVEHAPQRLLSLLRLASQPLLGSLSQSAKPAAQVYVHAPAAHDAVALGRSAQAMPQPPQWAVLVWVLASQPLPGVLSQSANGAVHAPTAHTPLLHMAIALGTSQRLPHAPHDAMLLCVSTQAWSQQVCPAGQGRVELHPITHTLPTQRVPAAQCSLVTHCTHWRVAVSQRPPMPPSPIHAASSRQPAAQALSAVQYCPLGQRSLVGVQGTQRPEAVSHTGPPALPTQSASPVQRAGPASTATSGPVSVWATSTPVSIAVTSGPVSRPVSAPRSFDTVASGVGPPTTELPSPHAAAEAVRASARAHRRCVSIGGVSPRGVRGNAAPDYQLVCVIRAHDLRATLVAP
jgi:hypothetical protein